MSQPCLHLLIIWSNALEKKGQIIYDLSSSFLIRHVTKIHWDEECFFDNYRTFYAHSLKHLNPKQFANVISNKIEHCGKGDFIAVVFEDEHPNMQLRKTSSGNRLVNVNVFDRKTEFRSLTGGGHRIHSSDDAWETNKDLTLLFGLNTSDFCNQYPESNTNEHYIRRNCVGVGGYTSIQQLFYVLNNAIRYCVLRNHECLPDEYTVEGHGDIDLLVEDRNYMAYLTLAKKVFPESYRVYHTIKIAGEEVPFDFRYVGDNYYDQPWEEHILEHRQLKKGLFYIPNPEDQFYSLLYHAYVQKCEVKEDYLPKLALYASEIGDVFKPEIESSIKQLDCYLEKNRFEYIRPNDKTVVYNLENIGKSAYAFRFGQLIKRLNVYGPEGFAYHSRVYEKSNSFVKIGTNWLIHNEAIYLKKLQDTDGFPKVLCEKYDSVHDESYIEITRAVGLGFGMFFSEINHQRRRYIKSFVLSCVDLLEKLYVHHIAHRDFLPANMIIADNDKRSQVSLIDFGWATDIENLNDNRPENLAGNYVSVENATDSYMLGMFLLDYWYDMPYIRIISKLLRSITYDDYLSGTLFKKKLDRLSLVAKIAFTPYDEWRLLCRRHLRIGWAKQAIIRFIRR